MNGPITRSGLLPFRLPLVRPWRFGPHSVTERIGWLVRLENTGGETGWGEAAPFPQIGTETPARARAWLEAVLPTLQGQTSSQALDGLESPRTAPPAARCALETALLDLSARERGIPLAQLLDPNALPRVAVHAAAGTLDGSAADRLQQAATAGFRCAKLKLAGDAAQQHRLLQRLLPSVPDNLSLRLDANRAWDPVSADAFVHHLDPARITLMEEPLAQGTPDAWARLQAVSPVPLALDESLDHRTLDAIVERTAVRTLVLKPNRLGGLLPCLAIARRALQAGMQSLVTTALDGALGTSAAAHLAAAVDAPGNPQIHGLATSDWLALDLAPPPQISDGAMDLPPGPGLGPRPRLAGEEPA